MDGVHVDGEGGDGDPAEGAHALQLEVDRLHVLLEALAVVESLLACRAHHLQPLSHCHMFSEQGTLVEDLDVIFFSFVVPHAQIRVPHIFHFNIYGTVPTRVPYPADLKLDGTVRLLVPINLNTKISTLKE